MAGDRADPELGDFRGLVRGLAALTGMAGVDDGAATPGEVAKLERLARLFLESAVEQLLGAHQALAEGRFQALHRAAHTLRTLGASVGAGSLERPASELEHALRPWLGARAPDAALRARAAQLVAAMEGALGRLSAPAVSDEE